MNGWGRRSKGRCIRTITQQGIEAQKGSRAAFGALYESMAGDLYRVALYTLGNPQDAEDAVAETFAEAWKGLKNLREPEAFRSWMFRILSFRCKRKIGRYVAQRREIDLDSYYETAEEAAPETATRHAELNEALGTLTVEERSIVLLSVLEGYTLREISAMLGLPQGTVSSKLSRTLKKLRRQLQENGKEAEK